jgi:hypothetical protein
VCALACSNQPQSVDLRQRTLAALHKVPLSLGRNCSSGWHPRLARPAAGLLSFTRRLPRIPCSLLGLEHGGRVHATDWKKIFGAQRSDNRFLLTMKISKFLEMHDGWGGRLRLFMWRATSSAGQACKWSTQFKKRLLRWGKRVEQPRRRSRHCHAYTGVWANRARAQHGDSDA